MFRNFLELNNIKQKIRLKQNKKVLSGSKTYNMKDIIRRLGRRSGGSVIFETKYSMINEILTT